MIPHMIVAKNTMSLEITPTAASGICCRKWTLRRNNAVCCFYDLHHSKGELLKQGTPKAQIRLVTGKQVRRCSKFSGTVLNRRMKYTAAMILDSSSHNCTSACPDAHTKHEQKSGQKSD